MLRTSALPIGSQNAEQLLGQHDIAILPTLAAADVDHHPGAVDILDGVYKLGLDLTDGAW